MIKRIVIGCSVAGTIGILLGYLGAYTEFKNECDHGASYSQWQKEALMLPALPGKLVVQRLRKYDYCLTEAWQLDKHRIALFNGAMYLPLGLMALIRRKIRIQHAVAGYASQARQP